MKQHFTDERTGISYTLQGDYYLPDLVLPAEEQVEVGIWGQRHLRHIKQNQRALYTNLLISGKLNSYLADINQQAELIECNCYIVYFVSFRALDFYHPIFSKPAKQYSKHRAQQLISTVG